MRLIDADELLKRKEDNQMISTHIIWNAPTVDAVPVIRCKDCKNWDTEWQNDWTKNDHYCPMIDGIRGGDWFCADAERKEE